MQQLDQAEMASFTADLRQFVAKRVPTQDADDVTQEILLRLHERLRALEHHDKIDAFVHAVARNAIADYFRARYRGPHLIRSDDAPEPVAEDDPQYDQQTHELVLSWLLPMAYTLPPKYRDALLLADFEKHPQQVVADRLGLSLSGAKSRIQRARVLLAQQLEACCEIEFGPAGRAIAYRRRK